MKQLLLRGSPALGTLRLWRGRQCLSSCHFSGKPTDVESWVPPGTLQNISVYVCLFSSIKFSLRIRITPCCFLDHSGIVPDASVAIECLPELYTHRQHSQCWGTDRCWKAMWFTSTAVFSGDTQMSPLFLSCVSLRWSLFSHHLQTRLWLWNPSWIQEKHVNEKYPLHCVPG